MKYIEMEIRDAEIKLLPSWERPVCPLNWKNHVIFGQECALRQETTSVLSARGLPAPHFLSMLGVCQFLLSTEHDLDPLFNLSEQLMPHMPQKWKFFQTEDVMVILTSFFEKCSIISLNDLNRVDNSLELWSGIVRDILRPMGKTDLKFIIDAGNKPQHYSAFMVGNLLEEVNRYTTVLWTEYAGLLRSVYRAVSQ